MEKLQSLREQQGAIHTKNSDLLTRANADVSKLTDQERAELQQVRGLLGSVDDAIYIEEAALRSKGIDDSNPIINRSAFVDYGGSDDKKRSQSPHEKLFEAALRGMPIPELRNDPQYRGMQSDVLTAGGLVLAPQMVVSGILTGLDESYELVSRTRAQRNVPLAGMGGVFEADSLDEPLWGHELSEATETDLRLEGRELKPIPSRMLVKVSEALARDPGFDIVGYIQERAAVKLRSRVEKAICLGDGTTVRSAITPLGLFHASDVGISTARDVETAGVGAIVGDDIIEFVHSVKGSVMQRSTIVLSQGALKVLRKLKDSSGQYIWTPNSGPSNTLVDGSPGTILGIPYYISDHAPGGMSSNFASGSYPMVIGDLNSYWSAFGEDVQVQVLTELYSATNEIGYKFTQRFDGMPVQESHFARLKVK